MSEFNDAKTEIENAKELILGILKSNSEFSADGVLTATVGDAFKKLHADHKSFRDLFPGQTISQFIGEYLSDDVQLAKDPLNPIKVFARAPSDRGEVVLDGAHGSTPRSRLPKKLFKLRSFLLSLSPEERQCFEMNGNFILSLLKDEN